MNLYERVDGYNSYDILFALAVGETPVIKKGEGPFQTAASFVFRHFQKPQRQKKPSIHAVKQALASYPDANVMFYFKQGASLEREFKWLGSYRYAVLNLGGLNRTDLFKRFRLLCQQLNLIDPLIKDQHLR